MTSSLVVSITATVTDIYMNSADAQNSNEECQKITIPLILQILKEHACLLCSLNHQVGEILPL